MDWLLEYPQKKLRNEELEGGEAKLLIQGYCYRSLLEGTVDLILSRSKRSVFRRCELVRAGGRGGRREAHRDIEVFLLDSPRLVHTKA